MAGECGGTFAGKCASGKRSLVPGPAGQRNPWAGFHKIHRLPCLSLAQHFGRRETRTNKPFAPFSGRISPQTGRKEAIPRHHELKMPPHYDGKSRLLAVAREPLQQLKILTPLVQLHLWAAAQWQNRNPFFNFLRPTRRVACLGQRSAMRAVGHLRPAARTPLAMEWSGLRGRCSMAPRGRQIRRGGIVSGQRRGQTRPAFTRSTSGTTSTFLAKA
jgi:hypothetical protein